MTTITYIDGDWIEGNPKVLGVMDQAFWFATGIFDGARAFDGLAPDLDRHCARALRSAAHMGMKPTQTVEDIVGIALDGCARFAPGAELYIRPLFYPQGDFVTIDPDTTRFMLSVHEAPLPDPGGFSACLSRYRRPAPDQAPTAAKAVCLYPQMCFALKEAIDKGFDNAVVLDPDGAVAEYATSNLWLAKNGAAITPTANGTFLNGITRQRLIKLLRAAGVEVIEKTVSWDEVRAADEVFSSGNYAKVKPVTRIEDRELQPGPVYRKARELYWDFARETPFRVPTR
ncbi:MAG: branched-chain amino acid aminotransferase [Alphaproteobacteria bacterium]